MAASDTITIAIRFRDGRVVCQERSAAPTPHWLRDARLLAGDEAFIQKYVDLAKLAQNDVQIPVGPTGHGLVVLDLRDGAYLTLQEHVDYRSLDLSLFGQYRNPQYLGIMTALAEAGRLRFRTRRPGSADAVGPVASVEDVLNAGGRQHGRADGEAVEDLLIDVAPFRHEAYSLTPEGMASMKGELRKLEFEPGEGWDDWLAARSAPKAAKGPVKKPAKKAAKPKRRPAASRPAPRPVEGS